MKNNAAFLYPGQGAQYVGMGKDLCETYPRGSERFDQADELLGFSIRQMCWTGPQEALNQDINAQLAVYIVSCIITDLLKSKGLWPGFCTGYSSGFYAAAYAAECFDFATGLAIVNNAGKILLRIGRALEGGMAVIFGLPVENVRTICRKTKHVEVAIINTPRQIIVSGLTTHVHKVMSHAMQAGALDVYILPVETAYHSSYMEKAGTRLLKVIDVADIHNPAVPLFSYADTLIVKDKNNLLNSMANQLYRPVLWVDLIRKVRDNYTNTMLEIGPGAMLSRSIRWIDRNIDIQNTASVNRIRKINRT